MTHSHIANSDFDSYVNTVEGRLDAMIDSDSDQDVFVSGYLHGHFSLVVSQLVSQGAADANALRHSMADSLKQAFDAGELAEADQRDVEDIWLRISSGIEGAA